MTGSAGFVGRHTATGLHTAGWTVTGVDQHPPREVGEWEAVTANAASPQILDRIRAGEFAVVVHNAAISNTLAPADERLHFANTTVPQRIAHACAGSRTRLIYASSGAVYGVVPKGISSAETDVMDRERCSGPLNAYARSKLDMDIAMLRRSTMLGLDCVGLRYTNVFGPGEQTKGRMASILFQIVTTVAAGQPVKLFDDTLTAARDYLPVRTLVEHLLAILDRPDIRGVFNLGSGVPVPFEQLLGWCTEWAGAPVPMIGVPNPICDRYQYWTCADLSQLRTAVPVLAPVTVDDIAEHARALFFGARDGSALLNSL